MSGDIYPQEIQTPPALVVNKLIIETRIEILYLRKTRVSSTKDLSVTLE